MQKRNLIFLLCSIAAVSLVVIAVLIINQDARREPMAYVEQHKKEWLDLIANNDDVIPYLEQLYAKNDEITINYRNGELTINGSGVKTASDEPRGIFSSGKDNILG